MSRAPTGLARYLAAREAVALACGALVATATACAEPPAPARQTRAAAQPDASATVTPTFCAGGLLCEATTPLCGWRVPAACVDRVERARVCRCALPELPDAALREFFESRYGASRPGPRGGLALVRGPTAKAGPPNAPQPTPATLRLSSGPGARSLWATPPAAGD